MKKVFIGWRRAARSCSCWGEWGDLRRELVPLRAKNICRSGRRTRAGLERKPETCGHDLVIFLKIGDVHSWPLYLYLGLIDEVDSKQINVQCIKVCRWLDLKHWPLASEEAALPTVPKPMPFSHFSAMDFSALMYFYTFTLYMFTSKLIDILLS